MRTMHKGTISLIIPTHSRPHLLPKAVDSARQAGNDVEVVVVDDGSTDETQSICRQIPGIRYIRSERNQGVAGARNLGIKTATGAYVAFLDDDDLRLPGSLDRQLEALEAKPEVALIYAPVLLCDQDARLTGGQLPPILPEGDLFWDLIEQRLTILLQSVLIRRECIERVGMLNVRLAGLDDWDLMVRLAEKYEFGVLTEPVAVYREATANSGQGSSVPAGLCERAFDHQRRLMALPRGAAATESTRLRARQNLRRQFTRYLLWNAASSLSAGERTAVRSNLRTLSRLNPMEMVRPGFIRMWLQSLIPSRVVQ